MLSSELSPYNEALSLSHDMSPSTPGKILTYPGEDVEINFDTSTTLDISTSYWTVRGHGGGVLTIVNSGANPIIRLHTNPLGINIGPSVILRGDTAEYGIESVAWVTEGLVVEGVVVEGVFTRHPMEFEFGNSNEPVMFPERFVVRGCSFLASSPSYYALSVERCLRGTIEGNYFAGDTSGFVRVNGVSFVNIQNNIFEAQSGTSMSILVRLTASGLAPYKVENVLVAHNTFICDSVVPSGGVLYLSGRPSVDRDPQSVTFANNLLSGTCGSIVAGEEAIQQFTCDSTRCLGDSNSVIKCNRADAGLNWMPGGPAIKWVNDMMNCGDSGAGGTISFSMMAPKPFPYYELSIDYLGETEATIQRDFLGNWRKATPSMGAIETVHYCGPDAHTNPEVCNYGNGSCDSTNVCSCYDHWVSVAPGFCNDYRCEDFVFALSESACSGHGTCTSTDRVCVCEDYYVNRVGFCDDFLCEDGTWGVNESTKMCSGHGSCTSTNLACICDPDYGHGTNSSGGTNETLYCGVCVGDNCENTDPDPDPETEFEFWLYVYIGAGAAGGSLLLLVGLIIVIVICCCCCHRCRNKERRFGQNDLTLPSHSIRDSSKAVLEINEDLCKINPKQIKLLKQIGQGGGGAVVFQAKWRGQITAYKLWTISAMGDDQVLFEKEIALASSLHHPNIVRFLGVTIDSPKLGLLMEFCESELGVFLKRRESEGNPVVLKKRMEIALGIAHGLSYLHSRGVIHRDLKPANVLVDSLMIPKDFGLSRVVTSGMTTRVGTSGFMAPEITMGLDYGKSIDIFSFGVTLWCLVTLEWFPYGVEAATNASIDFKVANQNVRPKIEGSSWNPLVAALCQDCWKTAGNDRPNAEDVAKKLEEICAVL